MPYFTISSSSRAWVPCGNGPTSEPTANGMPAAICFLNSLILYSSSGRSHARARRRRWRNIRISVKVGTAEMPFGLHEPHGLIAQLRGMVDGGDAGLRGVERSGLAHRMHGDAACPSARPHRHRALSSAAVY